MSSRVALVALLIAGVVCPVGLHAAAAETSTQPTRVVTAKTSSPATRTMRKASSTKAKSKAKKRKAKKKKLAAISRTPSKSSLRNITNMPRGYAWPPNQIMRTAETACAAELGELGVAFKPAKAEGRIVSAITVDSDDAGMTLGGITYASAYRKGPHKLDCQLARALEKFGPTLQELGVRTITFGSIYRWTNVRVNGKTKNILSRHALGIAMDIVSFTDEAGRVANVKQDYPAGDPLLLAVEDAVNASGVFRTVLTPKNDPISHSDHFHIEVAVDYTAPSP